MTSIVPARHVAMRRMLALLTFALLAPAAVASDDLASCAADDPQHCLADPLGATLQTADDDENDLLRLLYTLASDVPHPNFDYDPATRTLRVYDDANANLVYDEGEDLATGPVIHVVPGVGLLVVGDPAEDVRVEPVGTPVADPWRARVCPGRVADEDPSPEEVVAFAQSYALPLRCGGDMDGDGDDDLYELNLLRNPLRPAPGDSLAAVP